MIRKKCKRCGNKKPTSEFYRAINSEGRDSSCKECRKKVIRERYQKERERISAYEKTRNSTPKRKAYFAEAQRKHRKNNPEKYKARTQLNTAVRSGKVKRKPCQICGNKKSQGHHHDYSRPLDVRWLCFKCHREKEHGQVVIIPF